MARRSTELSPLTDRLIDAVDAVGMTVPPPVVAASDRVAPYLEAAWDRVAPYVDDVLDALAPYLERLDDLLQETVLPALGAAGAAVMERGGPSAEEARDRSAAAWAALRGAKPARRGFGWPTAALFVLAGAGAGAGGGYVLARRLASRAKPSGGTVTETARVTLAPAPVTSTTTAPMTTTETPGTTATRETVPLTAPAPADTSTSGGSTAG